MPHGTPISVASSLRNSDSRHHSDPFPPAPLSIACTLQSKQEMPQQTIFVPLDAGSKVIVIDRRVIVESVPAQVEALSMNLQSTLGGAYSTTTRAVDPLGWILDHQSQEIKVCKSSHIPPTPHPPLPPTHTPGPAPTPPPTWPGPDRYCTGRPLKLIRFRSLCDFWEC